MSQQQHADGTALQTIFGPVGAIGSATALAVAVYLVAESALLAAVLGALTGVGSYLMLPWVLTLEQPESESPTSESEDAFGSGSTDAADDSVGPTTAGGFELHRGAAGVALETGAIVGFAAFFVLEDPLLAAGIAPAAAVVEYPLLSLVLPEGGN